MEIALGVNQDRFGMVFVILILLGIGYNALVSWLERTHRLEGFVSLVVAIGVTWTLIGAALVVGVGHALTVALLFCASGGPMIWGSIARYVEQRHREEALLARGRRDDEGKDLAE